MNSWDHQYVLLLLKCHVAEEQTIISKGNCHFAIIFSRGYFQGHQYDIIDLGLSLHVPLATAFSGDTQKCLWLPPGLVLLSILQEAMKENKQNKPFPTISCHVYTADKWKQRLQQ